MGSIRISSDYAGGNIRLLAETGSEIHLEQELRDTLQWWFYWSFRTDAELAGTIEFVFHNGEVIGPWGPAISNDGMSWRWLGCDAVRANNRFRYSFEAGETCYFCFSIPYQLLHFECFYATICNHPLVRREVLTFSEQLKPIPKLVLGNPEASEHIYLTARHHSCESTSSYVLEGVLEALLESTVSLLLKKYCIHVIPFVDIDGVENGDQGKARAPHDHNRDYIEAPIYRATAAIIQEITALGSIAAGIDFHCPFKWGGRNDVPFIVKKGPPFKKEMERFGALLEMTTSSQPYATPISYSSAHDIEMGEDWNQPHGRSCSDFFARQGAKLAFSFEFPYFGSVEMGITPSNGKKFGAGFAKALEYYFLRNG